MSLYAGARRERVLRVLPTFTGQWADTTQIAEATKALCELRGHMSLVKILSPCISDFVNPGCHKRMDMELIWLSQDSR